MFVYIRGKMSQEIYPHRWKTGCFCDGGLTSHSNQRGGHYSFIILCINPTQFSWVKLLLRKKAEIVTFETRLKNLSISNDRLYYEHFKLMALLNFSNYHTKFKQDKDKKPLPEQG